MEYEIMLRWQDRKYWWKDFTRGLYKTICIWWPLNFCPVYSDRTISTSPFDNKLAQVSRHYEAFVFDTHLMIWKYYAYTKYVLECNWTAFIPFALNDAICMIIEMTSILRITLINKNKYLDPLNECTLHNIFIIFIFSQ